MIQLKQGCFSFGAIMHAHINHIANAGIEYMSDVGTPFLMYRQIKKRNFFRN